MLNFLIQVTTATYNESMLWGTYRPNLYFGTRTRTPESLLTGLMWFGTTSAENRPWENIRHSCEHDERISGYAWQKHDGKTFGIQTVEDSLYNVKIKTEFVKVPSTASGGDWAVRISGKPIDPTKPSDLILMFYAGFDSNGELLMENNVAKGKFLDVDFQLHVNEDENNSFDVPPLGGFPDMNEISSMAFQIPYENVWQMQDVVKAMIVQNAQTHLERLKNQPPPLPYLLYLDKKAISAGKGNVALYQRSIQGEFSIEFAFVSGNDASHLFESNFEKLFKERELVFDERFEKRFELAKKGFNEDQQDFGKMMLSNMLGGLGYFHGTSIVDRALEGLESTEPLDFLEVQEVDSNDDDYFSDDEDLDTQEEARKPSPEFEGPFTLFTGVPSRPFFPRGFLWDSGFDDHLISEWDNEISLDIMSHWTSLIDDNGWVAREQILGPEARSKVPQEFQIQYPHFANPPTLITAFKRYIDRITSSAIVLESGDLTWDESKQSEQFEYLNRVYPKFKKQFHWFIQTQWGQIKEYTNDPSMVGFRWRGKKGSHILPSGIDDYPRASSGSAELHVDLLSWMIYYAKTLREVAKQLNLDEDALYFKEQEDKYLKTLHDLHWDASSKLFTDLVIENDRKKHIAHAGYISIMPLLLGLLEHDSPKLGHLLDMVYDPDQLWSDFGICSLSKQDNYFGQGENYWRGPIWINMNYLLLSSLHNNYISVPGPYQTKSQQIYKKLRANIINNVYSEYQNTGYVWEQYSCTTGQGSRSHPFTGWTSLTLLMMSEKY